MAFDQLTVTEAILEAIRTNASSLYQAQVPQATQDNIAEVGEAIYEYDPTFNEFTGLLSKIALTLTVKRMFENKLGRFKSGSLETASTIEEYFIHKISPTQFDPDGANALAPHKTDISVAYYSENRQNTYSTTVSYKQIRNSFKSRDGVERLMNELVAELSNSASIDEYLLMKNLLGQTYQKATVYEVPNVADSAVSARRFVKTVRKASNDMEEPTSDFHLFFVEDTNNPGDYIRSDEIIQWTPKENQVLFINKDVEAEISVEVLASAFNRGDVTTPMKQVIVGDFGDEGEGIVGILADDRLLKVFDTYREILTQQNAKGAFVNYFLHIDQILALSPFSNVIIFKESDDGGV